MAQHYDPLFASCSLKNNAGISRLRHLTRETATAFEDAVKAQQPVTSKLIVQCLAEYLRDEQAVAELARRSLNGENAFRALVREVIRAEAEQVALAAVHGAEEAAC